MIMYSAKRRASKRIPRVGSAKINYEYLREYFPASYSPLVSVAKRTVAPGLYVLWGPHDLISAVFAVVLVFLVLLPTLIPFALIEEV
jgi:hypothetical protein